MCRQPWLAARPRTWLANGGVTKTTARSTSSSFNRSRAAALRSEDTVTTNGDESVRPSDIIGRLVWHALGAKTIDLINEHVQVEIPQ